MIQSNKSDGDTDLTETLRPSALSLDYRAPGLCSALLYLQPGAEEEKRSSSNGGSGSGSGSFLSMPDRMPSSRPMGMVSNVYPLWSTL